MNFSLLSVSTVPAINIGDYIQALASRQFLPKIDSYIEREHLKEYDGNKTNMIMNAYYMHDATQWPPSDKINPLLVSVHINTLVKDLMLSDEGIAYFKKHQPVGCRDYETERILRSHGIEAYFSGCMTLTLGKKYKSEHKNGKVYFVDVNLPVKNRKDKIKLMFLSVFHYKIIKTLFKKLSISTQSRHTPTEIWLKATRMYLGFRKLAEESLLLNANYLTHEDWKYNMLVDNDARIEAAENLVKCYAEASLVVTSRIHCALPCLAVGTPVYYVYDDNMPKYSSCRLDGLIQLFNVIHWNGKELRFDKACKGNGISLEKIIPNKTDYLRYSRELTERCENFVKSCLESE